MLQITKHAFLRSHQTMSYNAAPEVGLGHRGQAVEFGLDKKFHQQFYEAL